MTDLFNIARSGLDSAKKSLEVTGHNIANVNTKGYSPQRTLQSADIPIVRKGVIQGTGTIVDNIERIHDPQITKNILKHSSGHQYYKTRSEEMAKVENIFNEINEEGLNQTLNKFYNIFRELANQPGK